MLFPKLTPLTASLIALSALLGGIDSAHANPCATQAIVTSDFLRFQSQSNRNSDCSILVSSHPTLPAHANPGKRDFATSDRIRQDHRGALVITTTEEIPGEDRLSRITGTRTYLFFPRLTSLEIQAQPTSQTVELRLLNGEILRFDSATGRVRNYTGGEVREAEAIVLTNNGGIEFGPPRSGLILDCGWVRGRVAFEVRTGQCTFKDRNGQTCARPNPELFSEVRNSSGALIDNLFRFPTDEALAAYLSKSCPQLDSRWREPVQSQAEAPEVNPDHCGPSLPPSTDELGPWRDTLQGILPLTH